MVWCERGRLERRELRRRGREGDREVGRKEGMCFMDIDRYICACLVG